MIKSKRVRLSDQEAKKLGLKINKKCRKDANPQYSLSEQKRKELQKIRVNNIEKTPLEVKALTVQEDADGNAKQRWVKYDKPLNERLKAVETVVKTLKESIKPIPKSKEPTHESNSSLLNLYTLTDYHLGMMAWEDETGDNWDIKIAENTLISFFQVAIEQSPICDTCIFANIGDFLHWDGLDAVTPANKHVLDADSRFTKLVRVSIRVIKNVVNMLLEKYKKVVLIMAEGNHDPASSVWLREFFNEYYSKDNRIFVDTTAFPYYCHTFGDNFIGFHHGHKVNLNRLESVMISKYKKEFGESEKVYIHTGHLHHEIKKETNLSLIEQHRTLASKDSYASRGGWGSGRDSKVITYHKRHGEVKRSTFNIDMLK